MEYYMYTSGDALAHHGIRGMKWGVRRFQNKDGSLTAAGKKRRDKLESELEKLGGKKGSSEGGSGKKSISEMTNKELQEHTNRMQLEKNYYEAQRNLANAMPPKPVSKGQKIAEKFLNEAIVPAATSAGKNLMDKAMNKALGIDNKDTLAELKKTFDTLDYQQKIDKIKNPDKYLNWEEKTKKYKLQKDMEADAKAAREKAEADAAAKRKYDDDMRAYREYNENWANNTSSAEPKYGEYQKSGGERTYTSKAKTTVNDNANKTVTSLSTAVVSKGKSKVSDYDNFILDKKGNVLFGYNNDDNVRYRR